eukprot:jgi/Tetstr1/421139/TSEL_012182.t1
MVDDDNKTKIEEFLEARHAVSFARPMNKQPSTMGGFFDPQLGSVLGRGSFNATSSARRYDHYVLNDAHGSGNYAAAMREAWGRLQGLLPATSATQMRA